jgi:hypothetical protein
MYQKDSARMKNPSGVFAHRGSKKRSNQAVVVARTMSISMRMKIKPGPELGCYKSLIGNFFFPAVERGTSLSTSPRSTSE